MWKLVPFCRLERMRRFCLALVVLISLIASACSSSSATATSPPDSLPLVEASPATTAPPITTTTTTTAAPTTTTIAADPTRTFIATAKDHVTGLAPSVEPDGELFAMPWFQPNPHQFGTALTLMVTDGQPGDEWVKVLLPIRPNGQEAWVSTSDYEISALFTRAEVNVTTRRVTVWEKGEIVAETDAVVGASGSPTPIGSSYVAASVDNYHGEPALVMAMFSEALDTFDGGLPVIAIHRTFANGQESDANAASNGCIRIPPEVLRFLAETLPLGTPVDFVA